MLRTDFEYFLKLNTGLLLYDFDVLSIGEQERKKSHADLCDQLAEWISFYKPNQDAVRAAEREIYDTFADVVDRKEV